MRRGREISRADGFGVGAASEQIFDAGTVSARCGAEDAIKPRCAAGAPQRSQRIFIIGFVARGDRLHGGIKERDLRREQIAEQAGDAPGNIDTRASHGPSRQNLDAGHTAAGMIPDRPATHQRQALRDLLAAGAQGGAAPKIDHDGARRLAMRLQMRAQNFVGGEPAEVHRGLRRQRARIGGEEIAAGWQHVAPSARRRAGRAGRDAAAVERRDEGRAFGCARSPTIADRPCRQKPARKCAGRL